ncbi:adhesion G-protein coupled receptor G6 isoform X2 [Narcine bancroftii]|uniref:adhesion G-protein coupled receptor G6 isoform X2 n=1 Tax=Narcine bancroftii TaxID=1343680 RepID=UPI0038315675
MSHKARLWYVHIVGCDWTFLYLLVVLTSCLSPTAVYSCSDCTETLTDPSGQFTSPCYPKDYVSNLNCEWTILAPPGFIIQLTFHNFELEEAQGCPYDFISINTGAEEIIFCGVTAKGHTLNSTTNRMIVKFATDFSVQKRGFSTTYRQVAVSLRNQKVVVDQSSKMQAVLVSPSISIPELGQFTVCLEATLTIARHNWVLFSYMDSNDLKLIDFRREWSKILLVISDVECDMSNIFKDHFSEEVFNGNWRQLCMAWDGASGNVSIQTQNKHLINPCPDSIGKGITSKGTLTLAPKQHPSSKTFSGQLYNFRLWNFTMSGETLNNLPCGEKGNVVDWDNSDWDIPVSMLTADHQLSCASALPTPSTVRPSCSSLGSGCQASSPANSNTLPTNTHSTNSVDPSAHGSNSTFIEVTTPGFIETTELRQKNFTDSQNTSCNCSNSEGGVFYWTQFMVYDRSSEVTDIEDLKDKVSTWLTKSLQNWNYSMSVDNVSIFKSNGTPHHIAYRSIKDRSYNCLAILYYNISQNIHLEEQMVKERLRNTSSIIGDNLSIVDIRVQPIENCPSDEYPENYMWLETRPRVTIYIACSSNPAQNASRECFLNTQNYTSHWKNPDLINCTNNSGSESTVKKVNHLLDLSRDNLTPELVDKLVVKLQEVVTENVINSTLATTMITVMSNILSGSDTVLASSSNLALKTIDALMAKMIFSGPSVNINKPNLAIGILAVDSQTFNGTSFSVGQGKESSLEVSLDGKPPEDTLADIELSPSLLERLSEEEMSAVSRIQFAFFKRTGLFQGQQRFRLQSFVVASSVGNISINNLSEPVKIRIKLKKSELETSKMHCAFWDFALKNGSGGWKTDGCWADPKSGANETICFCNHLTHFGVLMDISRTAPQLDMVNIRILTFITHIGCGISAIFSATTLLTYVAFEKLRRDYPSKILMNLSTSLFFLNFTFLIDGWLASFNVFGLCVTVAALLHFFLLTSFTWMGLEAIHMYIALVKVFNTYIRKYILKFCIIGWGLPALMVLIVLAINSKNRNIYGISVYGKDSTDSGTTEFCWINDRIVFYVTCVCYFAILFLMNVSMFIVVLIQICGRNGKKSHRNMREEVLRNLRSATSLTFLLGMTWGFAFFAWGPLNLIFMYLFAIFNSLQGFFIFVFHCAMKENVQKQWRRYLCCGRFRLPENSDWSRTITNNTKKVSSENLGKSLSNSSIGSNSTSWTSKFKSGSSLFKSSTKGSLFSTVPSAKFGHLDPHQEPEVATNNIMDRTACYYPTHSDNFYKNLMMSDNFSHSTKF